MRSERGSATMWMIGLSMLLLVLGGLSMDLWRVLAERRLLASVADSAAVAAASALDLAVYRDGESPGGGGQVRLDPTEATRRALLAIDLSDVDLRSWPLVQFSDGDTRVEITLDSEVEFGLLKLLLGDRAFSVAATASATATEFE